MSSQVLVETPAPAVNAGALPVVKTGLLWHALLWLLMVAWAVDAARVLYQGAETAAAPVATCLTELHILHGSGEIAASRPLYPKAEGLPFTYHFYNPLTYLPAGLLGRVVPLDADGLLIAGRVLPFFAGLGILVLLGSYVRQQTRRWMFAALVAAMVLFYHSSTLTDFFRNRPETPALLLTLGGWIVVQLRPKHWPYLAAGLFVAALGFKQTYLAAPLACGLQLLWLREGRNLLKLTLSCVVLGLLMLAGCCLLGDGYFEHAVGAMQACPLDPIAGCNMFYPILIHGHWGMLFPAALVSVACLVYARQHGPLLLYLGICFVWTSIAHGKQGADLNYHGELSLLMVLTTVLALAKMRELPSPLAWCPLILLLLGTWMPIVSFGPGWNELSLQRIQHGPHAYQGPPTSNAALEAQRYAPYRGEALILDDAIAVRLGEPVVYDWYALKIFFETGHLDFNLLEQAIEREQYAVIVLKAGSPDWSSNHPSDKWNQKLCETALANGYQWGRRDARRWELWRAGCLPSGLATRE